MSDAATILFVDDEPLVSRLYGRAAASIGFNSVIADHPLLALEMIADDPPDLIISDMQMPELSGMEMVRRLKSEGKKAMPALFLSANEGAQIVIEGLEAGGDDFLIKGIGFEVIIRRMRFWIEGPFRALPAAVRTLALECLAADETHRDPLATIELPRDLLIERARVAVIDQYLEAPEDFGARPAERERLIGFVHGVLTRLLRSDATASIRLADHIIAVLAAADEALPALVRDELANFDGVASRPTFQHAAQSLLLMR